MSEELKDFNVTNKETIIELLNAYFSDEYNPLKDLISDNVIDSMISILRQRDGIFYCPNMQRNDYDPEKYTTILISELDYKLYCEKKWNEILGALKDKFNIYSQDVPEICKDIADRIHNNVNGCRRDVDNIREDINAKRKEICEIIAIHENSSWSTIMDCLKALRDAYVENKDKDNPENEPYFKFYKEVCDILGFSYSYPLNSVIDEVTKLKENHEELIQNYHDLSEIIRRKGY